MEPSLAAFFDQEPNNRQGSNSVDPPSFKGPLSGESDNHNEGKPTACHRFHCVGPEGTAAEFLSNGDFAISKVTHGRDRSQNDNESRPREGFSLPEPKAPEGCRSNIGSQNKEKTARNPAGPAFRVPGKQLAMLQFDPQPPYQHASRGQLNHAIQSERGQEKAASSQPRCDGNHGLNRHPANSQPFEAESFPDKGSAINTRLRWQYDRGSSATFACAGVVRFC